MSPLEEEICKLNLIWCNYVNLDHSKTKDRLWYITQQFAYGEMYYQASHWGYIADDFEGSKCKTIEEAQEELRDRLLLEIHKHKEYAIRNIKSYRDDGMELYSIEEYQRWLDVLDGKE